MSKHWLSGKRFIVFLTSLAMLVSMLAATSVISFKTDAASDYTPRRVMSMTANSSEVEGKMLISGSGTKFGAGKEVFVKGYYKVENLAATNGREDAMVQIGSLNVLADTNGWESFRLSYTTGDDAAHWLKFGFWYAHGTLSIADITIEDAEGKLLYDMATDADLVAGDRPAGGFPVSYGMWYLGYYTSAQNVTAHIDPVAAPAYTPNRVMSMTANSSEVEGKMLITGSGTKLGAGKDVVVKGYYKVENLAATNGSADAKVEIGSIGVTGNTAGWVPFSLNYTTGDDNWLKFGFWYAHGTLSIADITIEDADGKLLYDMAADVDLVAGDRPAGGFPVQYGMWYLGYYTSAQNVTAHIDPVYSAPAYTPKRVMSMTANSSEVEGKMLITGSGTKLGTGKDVVVKGYYKVENLAATNGSADAKVQIGSLNVLSDTDGWEAFSLNYTTGDDNWLKFGFWYAHGTLSIADITIEDADGEVLYNMCADADLVAGDREAGAFPVSYGMWYLGYYTGAQNVTAHIDPVVSGTDPNPDPPPVDPGLVPVPAVPDILAPDDTGYSPDRAFAIVSSTDANPLVKYGVFADEGYTDPGKYYIFARVRVSGFNAHEDADEAYCAILFNGEVIGKWTADTNGWAMLQTADGKPVSFDAMGEDDILRLQFVTKNAEACFAVGDLILANEKGEIVYSLANDQEMNLEGDMRYTTSTAWDGYDSTPENPTSAFPIRTKGAKEYKPNVSVTLDVTDLSQSPTAESFIFIDTGNALFTAGEKYTITGKINVNVYAGIKNWIHPRLEIAGIAPPKGSDSALYLSSTGGWASLVYPDGSPVTFTASSATGIKWIKFNLFQMNGSVSIADLVIRDSKGDVVYDMSKDSALLSTEEVADGVVVPAGQVFNFVRYDRTVASAEVNKAETFVTYPDSEYGVPTFDQSVTVPDIEEPDVTDPTEPEGPGATGDSAMLLLVSVMLTAAAAGLALTAGQKKRFIK